VAAYSIEDQLSWDELPPQQEIDADLTFPESPDDAVQRNAAQSVSSGIAPRSAAEPHLHLHDIKNPLTATVTGNFRLTDAAVDSDIRHIVLDFGNQVFPVLEGQSIGIIPPGVDASGKPHYMRLYSVASARDGERQGHNNLALTVKRVITDHEGQAVKGVASNYLCDLNQGDKVLVAGPYGSSFLMPNHAGSNLLMICTGTGAAPMRAMTEYRRRLAAQGTPVPGKLMLFFGARAPQELPYFGPLRKLPETLITSHLAFSRVDGEPRTYVQDKLREQSKAVAQLLRSDTYIYICGLRGMEAGVMAALREICDAAGFDWTFLHPNMVAEGRFHVETY
jgi:benzoyl-CoA 2,3-dioxygenase component A